MTKKTCNMEIYVRFALINTRFTCWKGMPVNEKVEFLQVQMIGNRIEARKLYCKERQIKKDYKIK